MESRKEKRKEEGKGLFNEKFVNNYSRCDLNYSSSFFSHDSTLKLVTKELKVVFVCMS